MPVHILLKSTLNSTSIIGAGKEAVSQPEPPATCGNSDDVRRGVQPSNIQAELSPHIAEHGANVTGSHVLNDVGAAQSSPNLALAHQLLPSLGIAAAIVPSSERASTLAVIAKLQANNPSICHVL
jgi:hypothetical protein